MLSKFEEIYRRFPLVKRGGDPRCQGVLRCQPMSQGEYILQKSLSTFEETYRRTPFVDRGILFNISVPSPSLFSLVFNSNQQKLSLWIYKFGIEVLQIQCTLQYHIQYSLKTTRVEFQINHTVWAIRTP